MAKRSIKTKTKTTSKSKEKLEQTVDLLVEEIEKTGQLKKITDDDLDDNTIFDDNTEIDDYVLPKRIKEEKEKEIEETEADDPLKNIEDDEKEVSSDVEDNEEVEDKETELEKEDKNNEEEKNLSKKEVVEKDEEEKRPVRRKTGDTNVYDFKFDKERLEEVDSLDTSFLEGRIKNKKKIVEEEIKKPKNLKNKKRTKSEKDKYYKKSRHGVPILLMIFLIIIAGGSGFLGCYFFVTKTETVVETKKIIKEKKVADDNYLFLGDSITYYYDLEKFYKDMPVIQSGICGDSTKDILEQINDRAYRYNPSKVFLLIGTNDYIKADGNESIEENIEKIIEGIQEKRPLAEIYVESIYPVNRSDDDKIDKKMVNKRENSDIIEANKIIKRIAEEKEVTYIDLYSKLLDEETEELKLEYTSDGLHISEEGYEVITEELKRYI